MAARPRRAGGAREIHVLPRHDRRGRHEDRRQLPDQRWPDPGAVWDRPWDPHTAWGRGDVRAEQLAGDLINDVHLAICRRVAQRSGWIVNTNPYEGGSDHTVFGKAGVPAVLDWHFTDCYYHTNFDTPDKTSAAEMRNVGVSVGASAWLLAAAGEPEALAAADLVAQAGRTRLDVEAREGAALAASAGDPSAARRRQTEIVTAWQRCTRRPCAAPFGWSSVRPARTPRAGSRRWRCRSSGEEGQEIAR